MKWLEDLRQKKTKKLNNDGVDDDDGFMDESQSYFVIYK